MSNAWLRVTPHGSSRVTGYAEVIPVNPNVPLLPDCRPFGSYCVVARIEMASNTPSYGTCVIVHGSPRLPAKLSRGYNRRSICHSLQALILAPMRLSGR
jgi:hypothetical protein